MRISKPFTLSVIFICLVGFACAQKQNPAQKTIPSSGKPKLIVGIVVDQMRYDYLFKYQNKYSENGFKRLLNEGFLCRQANYSYVPTYTGPGHACIFTGAPPSVNGIVDNDWYDRQSKSIVNCVSDATVTAVGTSSTTGMMSPRRLMCTTITDEFRFASNFKSKVIGISLKDRGAILPAGHTANAAYWHDSSSGTWVSSSYYIKELPPWLKAYNAQKRIFGFLSKPWTTLFPINQYTESTADDTRYEGLFPGETRPVFPHDLPAINDKDPYLIRKTPFGNTYTKELAIEAIKGENLGKGDETDFITISFSSTDYVGHMFGIRSVELEDTYLRLDRDLAELLTFLDSWLGKNNILVFLTADHGAADNPLSSEDENIPAGNILFQPVSDSLKSFLQKQFGPGEFIVNSSSGGIYLDHTLIAEKKIDLAEVQNKCVSFLSRFPQVSTSLAAEELKKGLLREGVAGFIQRGFFEQRSPDVSIALQPGWMEWWRPTGTTHGSAYTYDTHVPLIFYGWQIRNGSTSIPVDICDIAPTISDLLKIPLPSGALGNPIQGLSK